MSAATPREHSAPLPEHISRSELVLNDSRMDGIFQALDPDLVMFDRFMLEEQYGWRIEKNCPQALRLLDSIDVHSLRDIRRRALHQNRERSPQDWFSDIALRELASIYRCDLTLLISGAEYSILTEEVHIPPSLLFVLPFLLNPSERTLPANSPEYSARKDFISIGNFRHAPNADSVRYLHKELWPRLRKRCPQASLKVYGADLTPGIQSLHDPNNGFYLCGRAGKALDVMREARVCLAPLRYGAGLKGKLLDAMLAGTPSVTTAIGAEGMQGSYPWPGAVEDDPEDWITAAARLYQSEDAWKKAQHHISALLNGHFSKEHYLDSFTDKLEQLTHPEARQSMDRLFGALLRHHQHRSTEYMSRWIEAKNR